MELALLLIALGFGYKVFIDGSAQTKKELKQIGRLVGLLMMILGAAGASAEIKNMFQCDSPCFMGKFKGFGSKVMCSFSGPRAEKIPQN